MTEPGTGDRPPDGGREAMDALIAAARVRRGNVMDDVLELDNATVGKIKKRAQLFLEQQQGLPKRQRITRGKLANSIGVAKSTLSQVLGGSYPRSKENGYRTRDETLVKIDRFIDVFEAQRDAPQRSEFGWIDIAERIRAVGSAAVRLGSMGAVWCPAGCGKTLNSDTFGSFLCALALVAP